METIKLELTGTSPLLMHNPRMVDELDPATKALAKAVAEARAKKTDASRLNMRRCEFEGAIYHDDKLGPYVDSFVILAAMIEAARLERKGASLERGVAPVTGKVPLRYKGPRGIQELWDAGFYDVRPIGVNDKRIMRTRPKFTDWALEVELAYVPSLVSEETLFRYAQQAGVFMGLLDGRSIRMGRFSVTQLAA